VSPEKSTIVISPFDVALGLDTAIAYLVGCAAGPTTPIALTTGRYAFPHPAIIASDAVSPAAAAARPNDAAPRTAL
jgi:hypothetical protein